MNEEARRNKNDKTNQAGKSRSKILSTLFAATLAATSLSPFVRSPVSAQQNAAKPNILVIFGDDVGQSNISAYTATGCPTSIALPMKA
jgi:arylsulfatase